MSTDILQKDIVTPCIYHSREPLNLECGARLSKYQLVYETYGRLNAKKNNAILVCPALTANHHASGYSSIDDNKPGWWNDFIGKGKALDTNKFFVVCVNNIGGCHGSTGPLSINPHTNKRFAAQFPIVTVVDWVHSQNKLAQYLQIDQWHAVVGGSLGGMQVLQWSISYPDKVRHAIIIAAAAKLSAQNIAFNEIARRAIMTDSNFYDGNYADFSTPTAKTFPKSGLTLARMIGHVTYLSEHAMREKFGRELRSGKLNFSYDTEFQIEGYLRYQGDVFADNFDANSYLLMTKALDYFDPASRYDNNLELCLAHTQSNFFIISFSSDWRFPPERSQEISHALMAAKKNVSYLEIESNKGHDAFLIKNDTYIAALRAYLDNTIVN